MLSAWKFVSTILERLLKDNARDYALEYTHSPDQIKRRRVLVLEAVYRMSGSSSTEIWRAINLPKVTEQIVYRDLIVWMERGYVEKIGSRRWTRYYVA